MILNKQKNKTVLESNHCSKTLCYGGVIWNRELESENFMIKKYYYVRLNPYLINKAQ